MALYERDLELLENPTAGLIKEYRGWSKACAVAYEGYPALLSPDGRLRPNYKLHGTVTGRLSCEKPNLQQIPRVSSKTWDGALKRLFIPAEGFELWEADYSQLELRLGAAYAGERSLIEEFSKPDSDVFTRMANELGFSRGDTKTLTYTLQYGGGIKRLSDVFRVDAARADSIRSQYFNTYPGFRRLPQEAARKAKSRGYVKLWTGRRRHFENPEEEAHKAFNAVIQGGAAEIVKRTMLRLYESVDGPDCRMLLQVHDSVVFEIRSEMVESYTPRIKETMEAVTPDFGVKFAVQLKPWGKD
jgi:DNA polymerase-1